MAVALNAAVVLPSASAVNDKTSTVADPLGDAFFAPGLEAPPALDITSATFAISASSITFDVELAGPLGALSDPPGSRDAFFWTFVMDTDIDTFPPGFPLDPHAALPAEFMAYAVWDGASFTAFFLDRRPALTGGQMLQYPIPVAVSNSHITITAPAELAAVVQPLPGARWQVHTGWWNTPLLGKGTDAEHHADGTVWVVWPQ
jgi:hypothetical protein